MIVKRTDDKEMEDEWSYITELRAHTVLIQDAISDADNEESKRNMRKALRKTKKLYRCSKEYMDYLDEQANSEYES